MNKRLLTILVAVFAAFLASGSAFAQRGGGGGHGGGSMGGSAHAGGSGGWHGGSAGTWHGGSGGTWHGGSGWHGGYNGWHGGYYGGRYWYGGGWYGAGLATGLFLGAWPYWGYPYYGAYGYPYYGAYGYPYYGAAYGYPGYSQADTTTYVEQAPQAPVNNYWYYCTDPAGYFPYVQNCSREWLQVVPQNVPRPGAPNSQYQ